MRALTVLISVWMAAPALAQDIVVLGDSIMDWNGPNGIPAVLSRKLGVPIDDRSLAGAQISAGPLARLGGFDIRAQLGSDRPDIVVMTGGGNDLADACACRRDCMAEADVLLTPNGGGELGTFLTSIVADGTRVVYLGYADPPRSGNAFGGCMPALDVLADRLQTLPGVTFVSVKTVIDPDDPTLYDTDRLHPSRDGSAAMAALLADAIGAMR